ncbi:MAG: hypothetical protein IJI40_08665 [Firmicutes bacterium]|nr:hypothetical protein [Bacillota bacterium]
MKKLPGVLYYTAKTRPVDLAKPYPPPMTYADHIRDMTDEELAEWGATLPCCPPGPDLEELCYPQNVCENTDFARKCWLDWLKQEVKE